MPVDLSNLSIENLKKIKKDRQKTQERVCAIQTTSRKQKLIVDIMKIENQRKNIFKVVSKPTKPRVKTFDEYFQEFIKNRTILADTPPYLKKSS